MKIRALIFGLLLVGIIIASAREPVILKRADTLNSYEENGVRRQELEGNVWIVKDSLSVTCRRAIYYPDSGILYFSGNVEFRDPQRLLIADKVYYNEHTEEVEATGDVRIYQDTLAITSKRAIYRERLKSGYFYDQVRLRDDSRRLMLNGDVGYFDHEQKYARVTGEPVLTERDSSLKVRTEIEADTIEYFGDREIAHAVNNVVIYRDSLIARGDDLFYYKDSSYAELLGQPHAEQGSNKISGDTLRLYFNADEEQLEYVEVLGHAVATSPADTLRPEPLNRMEGKRMTLWMSDNAVTEALIEDNAIATYYIREDGEPRGMDKTSGDRLRVFFADGRISRIRVEGGTQGEYLPQPLVENNSEP